MLSTHHSALSTLCYSGRPHIGGQYKNVEKSRVSGYLAKVRAGGIVLHIGRSHVTWLCSTHPFRRCKSE